MLQVGQSVDKDGGWPLEVMRNDNGGHLGEVYLQPGEMVLYEGARLKHGRPMRLKGDEFGNVGLPLCSSQICPDTIRLSRADFLSLCTGQLEGKEDKEGPMDARDALRRRRHRNKVCRPRRIVNKESQR